MKYNTEREQLIIPEYGRHVQKMVAFATKVKDSEEKKKCVDAIISYMGQLNPHLRDIPEYKHKLWDHLFIMSKFELEVDSPFEKPSAEKLNEKPDQIEYPKSEFTFSYYGKHIETMIKTASKMEDGDEKLILTGMILNHMKKCYLTWSKSSVDNKTIFKHLDKLSEGKLQAHADFDIIDDIKATRKISSKKNKRNQQNNKNKKKRL
ncbi:MAG: methionyl-tRNA formyltransferase [Flavobacteriales bacterium]|nr:methionyl-tRNA formyltransferase [Flavobacteriales bacterium]|tara:strand:- start:4840 stop:5457 length:618 start_codon:yes stop_codon:yes gene_type:complete